MTDAHLESLLSKLLKALSETVFVEAENSVTGEVTDLNPQIADQEATIKIRGEWDREDLKGVLKSLFNDAIHLADMKLTYEPSSGMIVPTKG